MEAIVHKADRLMTAVLDGLVIALAGLLLALLNYAVFARFVLNESVSWGEELPAYLLASLTFIGAAYLTRTNEHIGFDGFVRLMPRRLRTIMLSGNLVVMLVFAAVMTWYGAIATWSFGARPLISLDVPMALFRAAVPFGCGLITLICAVRLVAIATGRIDSDDLLPETDA